MRCPFLEEEIVRYCKAFPIRKLIPSTSSDKLCLCLSEDYIRCSEYCEFTRINDDAMKMKAQKLRGMLKKRCPFLEEEIVRYCKAFPIRKLIPSNSLNNLSLCLSEDYVKCSEYIKFEKIKEDSMNTQKVRGDVKFFPPGYWRICKVLGCSVCPYESVCVAASATEREVSFIEGFALLDNLYYHPKHIWIEPRKDGTIRIGLDDFARKLLGNITGIDLPEKGKMIKQGESVWEIRCSERSAKLCSPIAGKIKRPNKKLIDRCSILNEDPYDSWLFVLEPSDLESNLNTLLTGDNAKSWLEMEADRLHYRIESDIGVTVADGGVLVPTVEKIEKDEWQSLVKDFLLTVD